MNLMNNIINVKDSNNNKSIINNDMADSTMYGIWDHTLPARTVHIDMDSIVGGKVRDMKRALIKNYLHLPNRLKVIVIAAINNIGAGERADDIIKEMEVFKQVVADHNKKWKQSPLSFTDICIVAVAPKFCSLTVPPNPPEPEIAAWVPPPQLQNKYSKLKKLNSMTIDLNKKDNLADIRLDYHGVKRFKSGTTQHIFDMHA